ncbi:uncharacterized protein I206_101318 [Kwoniella pini CBS 10737]|uniref:Uncharacterized protein n=1 Tax=Kwoniella pini CBS 10737 TaxID=1296096 RepID=A0A1B9IBE5_9TREE|nr:uncharacterized protein I206_00006 [Kwoniella pini CBS 10737]OCF52710.1 hypothetical protein I206_00006 [Kwoniella pini CBS 10737]
MSWSAHSLLHSAKRRLPPWRSYWRSQNRSNQSRPNISKPHFVHSLVFPGCSSHYGPSVSRRSSTFSRSPDLPFIEPSRPNHPDDDGYNDTGQTGSDPYLADFDRAADDLLQATQSMIDAKRSCLRAESAGSRSWSELFGDRKRAWDAEKNALIEYGEDFRRSALAPDNLMRKLDSENFSTPDPTSFESYDKQVAEGNFSILSSALRSPFPPQLQWSPIVARSLFDKPLNLTYPSDLCDNSSLNALRYEVPELFQRPSCPYSSHGETEPDDIYRRVSLEDPRLDLYDITVGPSQTSGDTISQTDNVSSNPPDSPQKSFPSDLSDDSARSFCDALTRPASIDVTYDIGDYLHRSPSTSSGNTTFDDFLEPEKFGSLDDSTEASRSVQRSSSLHQQSASLASAVSYVTTTLESSLGDKWGQWWKGSRTVT